jgi:nucleoside-diphosphate-sugar epimerase
MQILITGGAGFVGRHYSAFLLLKGYSVTVVDSIVPLTGGIDPNICGWPLFDPRDFDKFLFLKKDCRDFFKENRNQHFDVVIHLAAMVGGREMIEHNPLSVAEDLAIDSDFWNWAKEARPGHIMCFSSSAAYPVDLQKPNAYRLLREDDISFSSKIGMPDMSYGWAKLTHEYLAQVAYEKYGLNSTVFRPFSGYGEDQDLAYPFPSIIKRAIDNKNRQQMTVWGTGDQMRDFIHISDCVKISWAAKDVISDGSAINLSTGILTSFKTYAQLVCNKLGYDPVISGTSNKPEGVFARGGCTKKQQSFGLSYDINFDSGVDLAIKYFENKL